MRLTTETLEKSQVLLHIELETPEMEKVLEDSYKKLGRKVQVPGFRRGKVPRGMLEHFLGKETVLQEAAEQAVAEFYNRAIEENQIHAIAQPKIEVLHNDPLAFRATVPVRPEVDLGDYKGIRLAQDEARLEPSDVDKALEQLRLQQAPWEPVERPVAFGDMVTMDVQATAGDKTVTDQKGIQYQVVEGSPAPVPGFAEKLVDLEKGAEATFSIALPAAQEGPEAAGQAMDFKVQVAEVRQKRLPELNDDFARSLGEGLETLEQVKERLAANLKARAEAEARARYEEQVVQAAMDLARVDLPEVMVDREVEAVMTEQASRFRGGQRELDEYLRNIGKTKDQVQEELRPKARHRVLRSLVLDKLADVEDIKVTPEEVQAEIDGVAGQAGERAVQVRRAFDSPQSRHNLEHAIMARKTVLRLAEIAATAEEQPEMAEEQAPGSEAAHSSVVES